MLRTISLSVAYVVLGICVLAGAWAPLNGQILPALWMYLAVAAAVGLAAGGLAPRALPVWLAWPVLVVLAWAAFAYVAIVLVPSSQAPRYLVYPLAASIGVAAGLAARRLPARRHRWRFAPIVLAAAAIAGVFFLAGALARWSVPPVAAFTLQLLDGGQVRSNDLAGKTVVLAFWATWCEPCRKELPELSALYKNHYASNEAVAFYVVDEGFGNETPAMAKAFLAHYGVEIPAAYDAEGGLGGKLDTQGVLPVRVVIGPDGRERFRGYGYDASDVGFHHLRAAIAASTDAP